MTENTSAQAQTETSEVSPVTKQPAVTENAEVNDKTIMQQADKKNTVVTQSPVKKAPSKKTSPAGRRGIRLKDDSDS